MTTATERLWRTEDGGLVLDGDPDAVALAYAPGDQIAKGDVDKLPKTKADAEPEPEAKAKPAPANKVRAKAADK
jgi:hypothetical protein